MILADVSDSVECRALSHLYKGKVCFSTHEQTLLTWWQTNEECKRRNATLLTVNYNTFSYYTHVDTTTYCFDQLLDISNVTVLCNHRNIDVVSLKIYSLQIRDAGIQEELEQYLQGSGENYWIGLTRWNWEWKVIAGKPVYNLGESNSDRSGSIKALLFQCCLSGVFVFVMLLKSTQSLPICFTQHFPLSF